MAHGCAATCGAMGARRDAGRVGRGVDNTPRNHLLVVTLLNKNFDDRPARCANIRFFQTRRVGTVARVAAREPRAKPRRPTSGAAVAAATPPTYMQCRVALKTLGLGSVPHASARDVRMAYLRMARLHHPDTLAGGAASSIEAGEARFKEVVNAYEKLIGGAGKRRRVTTRTGPTWEQRGVDPCWTDWVWAGVRSGRFWLWGYAATFVLVGTALVDDWTGGRRRVMHSTRRY